MHIDGHDVKEGDVLKSDICIVGAGPAGIAVAERLSDTSLDICLLESGGLNSGCGEQDSYDGTNTGLSYYPLSEARAEGFGGSTKLWGGYCAPLDPIVFQKRSWVPHSGWPIDREDLDPYYSIAHRILNVGPFRYEPEHWEEEIQEYHRFLTDSPAINTRVIQFSESHLRGKSNGHTGWVDPTRFGELRRDDLLRAENVALVTHARITNIETPPSAATVTGLQVRCADGSSFRAEADQYVLACGGIENPRLLLSADRYAPDGLGNEQGLVGRFFMEHPHVPSASLHLSGPKALHAYRLHFSLYAHRFGFESRPPFFHLDVGEDIQESERILNGHLRLDARSSGLRSAQTLVRRLKSGGPNLRYGKETWRDIKSVSADPKSVVSGLYRSLPGNDSRDYRFGRLNVLTIAEQAPNPNSRVTLGEERDSFGLQKPKLNWELSELDRRSVLRLNKIFAREMARMGEGRADVSEWLADEDEWDNREPADPLRYMLEGPRPPRFWGVRHHMGTTRMASSPQNGVCNEHSRVYGVNNLYLAGSSVFPTVGSAPPTLTIVALAARLADHLANVSN